MAWGVMGGGGEGRVAVRAFQWETQWEQLDPCPEAEWPLVGSETLFTAPAVVPRQNDRPMKDDNNNSGITVSRFLSGASDVTTTSQHRKSDSNIRSPDDRLGSKDCLSPLQIQGGGENGATGEFLHDNVPVQLMQVVVMAAERVVALRPSGSLAEAVYTSPHRLIQHVMTAQKKHLKTK